MPATCVLDVGLNGEGLDAAGLPTRLLVYGRVQGTCSRVRFTVRLTQTSPVLLSGDATPDSNGTCAVEFPLPVPAFPCGSRFWVEAECVEGGTCSVTTSLPVSCKDRPGTGGGTGPGGGSGPGGGGTSDWWPWPLPPVLFCPLMGRSFTTALLFGLMLIVTGVAFVMPAIVAGGVAIVAGAFAILAVWQYWCLVNSCYLRGAVLWALLRAIAAGAILAVVTLSVATWLLTLTLGAIAGIVTARLRAGRCPIPDLTTPLQQLPLW